ncbi:B12-binding domain-containing radical SAM protein [Kitasatospora viridis]|uniref:Radical SAM superfamily enzyme YgiQ (UPF0313 family) n=1 Tax=Kitasatospora viridis TaxID=281105 RepID=A0A561T6A1_9ACTN|nr:radical SAM protein [Kitasatospora viridis]TWF82640.1 radical SAM superfamily enzyme YgiQ (UPF0313 family) [Kitasatospora viridis]
MPPTARVLVIWPPQVLSYFNAGHHLALYQVAGHLRRQLPDAEVRVIDAPVERLTWKDLADELYQRQYDAIAVMNDFDGVDGLHRFLRYAGQLSPAARTVAFGRLSGLVPGAFRNFGLDAVVESGDFEAGVAEAVQHFLGAAGAPAGVSVRDGEQWRPPAAPGRLLPPQDWVLPAPQEIPYERYDEMYRNDANKFCGVPHRRELVVPAARGCPVGCAYCEVPELFGKRERRLSVERTVAYIRESFRAAPFEYVAFYAPTFTLDRPWVLRFCEQLAQGPRIPWKCATTMHHLDEALVRRMGEAGCVRISVGLETLDSGGHPALPRAKHKAEQDVEELARWCAAAGVELNCFVIVGLPGTGIDGARRTIAKVHELGGRARPTVYCPVERLHPGLDDRELAEFNRQLFVGGSHALTPEELCEAYALVFGAATDQTTVFTRIPQRRPPSDRVDGADGAAAEPLTAAGAEPPR